MWHNVLSAHCVLQDLRVLFHLKKQHFIELLRLGTGEAVAQALGE